MRLQEFGFAIRQARLDRSMTQAELAKAAGVSRTTVNQLENGLFTNLSVNKLQSLLEKVGLSLSLVADSNTPRPDPFQVACTMASVSYRTDLTVDELIRGLMTGKIPDGKRPHFRTLLEEAPEQLIQSLINEINRWCEPGKIRKNLSAIAHTQGAFNFNKRDWVRLLA